MDSAQEEIIKLSQIISQWQHSYYAGHPEVDDAHFDLAFDRLLDLEKEYPQFVLPDSPTSRVGSDLTNDLAQVEHTLPVLSLDKAYTLEEIHTWIEKTQKNAEGDLALTLEEKLDGVSIVLYYKDGLLDKAVTRGNGAVGNDVTANVKTISSIPLRLPEQVNLVARGEIFMTKRNFAQQNAKVGEIFANPRNYAAGTIRRKISREVAEVPLDIFVYEGFFDPPLDSQEQILKKLEEFGFPLNKNRGFFGQKAETEGFWEFQGNFDTLEQQIQLAAQRRSSLDYEIDGLVLKVNDIDTRERLGFTGHHPRWALAYKFESPQGISVVLGIDVQVGRTGRITPVARISPVEVGGSTISNVTLHNQGYIDALELGIGDEVVVSKRGDVIPAIERVIESRSESVYRLPERCPSCGTTLTTEGAHLFCTNPQCPDQIRGRLFFFVGKAQMDIENLGPETVDFLMNKYKINTPADLYGLPYQELVDEAGFGEKKVKLLTEGLEKSKGQPFSRVLVSLGIPDLGKKAVQLLFENGYNSVDKVLEVSKTPEKLLDITGFGQKTAQSLAKELAKPSVQALIDGLKAAGLAMEEEVKQAARDDFAGQAWCVTGSFANFKPRSLAEDAIAARGGRVVSAVSGATTHLLAGDKAGSKLAKAQKLGTIVVSEEEFVSLLEASPIE